MTDKRKTIKELKEALDSLDITNKYRLNLIRAIEYLQEEPVSEGLEEAAKNAGQKYFPNEYNIWARPNYEAVKAECAFKDGANWQKQQDKETIELAEDHAMLAGMEKMKEEMMAKAINTETSFTVSVPRICISLPLGVNVGDRVKVIVIKEG